MNLQVDPFQLVGDCSSHVDIAATGVVRSFNQTTLLECLCSCRCRLCTIVWRSPPIPCMFMIVSAVS